MIIREFRCRDCGTTFESFDPEPTCPHCSEEDAERVFLTPPAVNSSNTRRADTIQKELAADFGMANMSNRHGEPVRKAGNDSPAKFTGDQKIMANLQRLGSAGDNFSQMLPSLRAGSNPTWGKNAMRYKAPK